MKDTTRKILYLVDASIYIFRAYYSIPEDMQDADGNPTNAVYGFANFLWQLLNKVQPSHIAVAFDESLSSSFRNQLYPEYKANREEAPDELKWQFKQCQKLSSALGLPVFSSKKYEADDLIGTLAGKMRSHGFASVLVSRDKDLVQLLNPGDVFWDFANDRKVTFKTVKAHYGVTASQMVDLLALRGDAVDNIPGVPGIGEKTAQALLHQFGSMDEVFAGLDEVPSMKLRGAKRVHKLLNEHREQAYLSQQLARIHCDAPLQCTAKSLEWKMPEPTGLKRLFKQLKFGDHLHGRFIRLYGEA